MLTIRKTIKVKVNNNKTPMTGLTIMIIKKKKKILLIKYSRIQIF